MTKKWESSMPTWKKLMVPVIGLEMLPKSMI